jgi:F-type H+-transporting ATPase subunit delta
VKPALEGYSEAIFDEVGSATAAAADLASELAAVASLVDRNAELRLALTDTAVPAAARRRILAELLENKVSAAASRVASFAAGAVGAPDVPAALHWAAHEAKALGEGTTRENDLLSLLSSRQRVGGYASAVFETVATNDLEEVEEQLFRFARTIEAAPSLRTALSNLDLPVSERIGIIDDLLTGKVLAPTLRLVRYVVAAGRARDLLGTLDWLVELTAQARGWRVARVHAASAIAPDQEAELSSSLGTLTGSPVELQVSVEPALLSGVVVEVGDLLVDATVRRRLDDLKEHLVTDEWRETGLSSSRPRSTAEGAH